MLLRLSCCLNEYPMAVLTTQGLKRESRQLRLHIMHAKTIYVLAEMITPVIGDAHKEEQTTVVYL
jgi:hypothetical protein